MLGFSSLSSIALHKETLNSSGVIFETQSGSNSKTKTIVFIHPFS
ncbi:hypothetical protein F926_02095 [Acinetobacter haemolyticus NIPH 261]|nr:hypothetical protein F926_02095 [Acinetobacter haemolyticus NIPH 261]